MHRKSIFSVQCVQIDAAYLLTPPSQDPGLIQQDSARHGHHGTAVLSKITGRRVGTAPDAHLVLVQCVNEFDYVTTAHWFGGLLATFDDIVQHKYKSVVINLSWLFDVDKTFDSRAPDLANPCADSRLQAGCVKTMEVIASMARDILREFEELKSVIVVIAGGNSAPDQMINGSGRPKTR
ncbi:hypothetical protein DRE_01127 [Drechslerella stenobrocha 248]|uniref:Peptidase S8/S53 domain-containing protein n=1 Tax=Drechslerella stenobrocha 248 TaxID=1043628 RepID=W7HJZ0_9PEZI|nr:hypothetical protein DRE_01127 [Drechslerella stenobrocha 248]